ncbi:mechanosensitive ion channel family protein [Echinicola vietnamensis]|uniref:Small-conductance mechanosensitive channel n=1 Tax=Echinicola vietnamensis (strain DSM 17526 / LMG 23754 / KMM 6221) TaxID=926556 RepID=L0G0C8_ECHVK|nr:mechanosensitive ion channel family protein [Echinicola vietnamensis]AGA78330.1 small-conductance mechanosensitive channel [Echinicola vietnamensis DSM 17526]
MVVRFRFLLLGWLLLVSNVLYGVDGEFDKDFPQIQDTASYVNLSTPYTTTLTFFLNLEERNFKPENAAKTLGGDLTPEQARKQVVKLKQIFDGQGVFVDVDNVPNEANYTDSTRSYQAKYFYDNNRLPKIFLEKTGDKWKFSSYTVSQINELHKETYPYGTAKLLNLLPKIGQQVYLGLHLWQLCGIFLLVLFVFTAHKLFTFIVDRGMFHVSLKLGYKQVAETYLLPVARVISIYFVVLLVDIFIRVLQLPIEVVSWIVILLNAAKPLIITIVFYKLADLLSAYFERQADKTESNLDDQLVPLVRKTLKAFIIIVGSLFILKNGLQVDIWPFLTGLSIGGLAFALAAQDTIKNFFGSVMIFIDKPFQVGDWITSGDVDGTVEEVGFRSTRVRTFRNSLMYIPNGRIADATIDNHGLRQYRRFSTTITITYGTPPELINVFVEGLREIVKNHPLTRKDFYNVYFNNMSAYSLDIMFYVFFEVPTWGDELKGRHEILIQIVKLANELGVNFAFPTQTLHMETFPEKEGLSPIYEDNADAYKQRLDAFIKKEMKK